MRRFAVVAIAALFSAACQGDGKPNLTDPGSRDPAHVPSFTTVQSPSGATFSTDKDDYSPGETLNLSGGGWTAGDVLDVVLDETPQNHAPVSWSINVDSTGAFTDGSYVVQESDAGVTFTIMATSRVSGETVQATFTDSPSPPSGSLCADAPGAGTSVCPSPATTATTAHNNTHYAQQVGTTATYQILGVPDFVQGTGGCSASEVAVQIQSTPMGNAITCGSLVGSDIIFTWTAPANACLTTHVSYATTASSGFTGADNDIIKDDVDDGNSGAAAGIAYVDASGVVVEANEDGTCGTTVVEAADLGVSKDAAGTYNNTYAWTITKDADPTLVEQFGGTATFNYSIKVSHDAGTISAVKVTGTITVSNPNAASVTIDGISDALTDATTCTVTNGGSQALAPGNTTFAYSCDLAALPAAGIGNSVTVTWSEQTLTDATHLAAGSANFGYPSDFPTSAVVFTGSDIDECVDVTDSYNGSLGQTCVGDANPDEYTYSRTINVPAYNCLTYDNTASFTTTDDANDTDATGSASKTVKVCGPAKTGDVTMGFWKNKNGQDIIKAGASTAGVCNSGTWLRQYAPFQNLSATATCAQVAAYVSTTVTAASASGAAMNAMLKGQMIGTALGVYFSDPALGTNKINAPAPIGAVTIDLTKICATVYNPTPSTSACLGGITQNVGGAFGGATSLTVSQILTYAASQSNAGGTAWYGQVKATQELAKDTFDALNNQLAFAP